MTSAHTVVALLRLSLEYEESVIVCVVKLGMINSLYSRAEPAMNSDALAWNSHIVFFILLLRTFALILYNTLLLHKDSFLCYRIQNPAG